MLSERDGQGRGRKTEVEAVLISALVQTRSSTRVHSGLLSLPVLHQVELQASSEFA